MDPDAARGAPGCSACCATSTATSTTPRPTPRCPTRWAAADGRCSTSRCRRRCSAGSPRASRRPGAPTGARVMVEKPFGTDLASAQELNATMHEVLPRGRDLPGRPLARPGPAGQRPVRPVRQLDHRAAVQPDARGEHPDHDGGGVRRRRPGPVLRPRPAPSATSCRTTCCRCWPPSLADPPDRHRPDRLAGREGPARQGALRPLSPATTCSGQYEGYLDVDGVAPGVDDRDLRGGPAGAGHLAVGGVPIIDQGRQDACRSRRPR